MTDFLQNLNFRRALEGELTRTIMQLSEVQAARVHIVMPKDRLFKEDKKEATASVVLKLRKGPASVEDARSPASRISWRRPWRVSTRRISPLSITKATCFLGRSETIRWRDCPARSWKFARTSRQYLEDKAQSMLDGVLGDRAKRSFA